MTAALAQRALDLAALAPSAHNAQPWRVELHGERFEVYRDPVRTLRASDPTLRQTFISLGAFIEALGLSLEGLGLGNETEIHAFDPQIDGCMATIHVKGQLHNEDAMILDLIQSRRTDRSFYEDNPVEDYVIKFLLSLGDKPGIQTWVRTRKDDKKAIANLVRQATQIALEVPAVRRELAEFVSYDSEQRSIGLIYEDLTSGPLPGCSAGDWVLHHLSSTQEANLAYERFIGAPLHFGINATWESCDAWIEVGRTLYKALIYITECQLHHCIAAGPIEVPIIAGRFRPLIGLEGKPQVLARFGRSQSSTSHAKRRLNRVLTLGVGPST